MRSLIDVVELVELRQHVVILDVRWRLQGPSGLADYEASHIPGAVFVDLDRDLAAEPGRAWPPSFAARSRLRAGDAPLRRIQ